VVWLVNNATYFSESGNGFGGKEWKRDLRQDSKEILAGEFPFERFSDRFIALLEIHDMRLKCRQIGKFIGCEDLSLKDREVDFDLVEPTGMDGCMDENGVTMPATQAGRGGLTPMRGPIVRYPEDAMSRAIGLLAHHQINQMMKRLDAGGGFATAKELGSMDVPSRDIGQSATTFVFVLHAPQTMRPRGHAGSQTRPGLNTGLLVAANHVILLAQGASFPYAMIQVEHAAGLPGEVRVPRPDPTAIAPRPNRVGAEPTPNGRPADGGRDATAHGFLGDVLMTESRERQAQLHGQFARQGLNLHDDLRGKKREVALALVAHPSQASVPHRNAFAIETQSGAAAKGIPRSACCPCLGQQGAPPSP